MRPTRVDGNLVGDTVNGLPAFILPAPDSYSVSQGISTREPGGIDAGITGLLMTTFRLTQPFSTSESPAPEAAADLLNKVAEKINPTAVGLFASPFACLSFSEKVAVFALLEQHFFCTRPHELAALRLLVQSEQNRATVRRQRWFTWQHSEVW